MSGDPFAFGLRPWESPQSLDARPRPTTPDRQQVSRQAPANVVPVSDSSRYVELIESIAAVGVVSALILARPGDGVRNMLLVRNSGATTLYLAFGNNASVNSTIRMAANAMILFDAGVPQNDLYAISDAAGGQLSYSYGTTNES